MTGKTTIEFGDGVTGARLPTGQDNVRAIYRKGIGLDGIVSAGQLTSLLTRRLVSSPRRIPKTRLERKIANRSTMRAQTRR